MDTNPSQAATAQTYYPIRHVAGVTGVNPVTLRAWERRYALVVPKRTESGHRLYSQRDVERIARAVQMLDAGMSISQACKAIASRAETTRTPQSNVMWSALRKRTLTAVAGFCDEDLEDLLRSLLDRYPLHTVFAQHLVPALEEVCGPAANATSAEARFLRSFVRNKLGARFHHRATRRHGPIVVCAALPGALSELALLVFSCAAHDAGMRPVLLGAGIDIGVICVAARRARADGIVIVAHDAPSLAAKLDAIADVATPDEVPVFVTGAGTADRQELIRRAGAVPLDGNFSADILSMRHTLESALPKRGAAEGGRQ